MTSKSINHNFSQIDLTYKIGNGSMCFSAGASFSASTFLFAMGIAASYQVTSKNQRLFSLTPFGFAIQQFCEGMVWLSTTHENFPGTLLPIFEWGYILFAYIIWPIWIPLIFFQMEPQKLRKRLMLVFVALGVAVTLYNLFNPDYNVHIQNYSIQYTNTPAPFAHLAAFAFVTVMPSFISTVPLCWCFGIIASFVFILTSFTQHNDNFVSLWCLYAALISSLIIYILYNSKRKS